MTKLAIIDGDGVLWDSEKRMSIARFVGNRISAIKGDPPSDKIDWPTAFHPVLLGLDTPYAYTHAALCYFVDRGFVVEVLTSNPKTTHLARTQWLLDSGLPLVRLVMKDTGTPADPRDIYMKTPDWKARMVLELIADFEKVEEVIFIDDNEANREAISALGDPRIIVDRSLVKYAQLLPESEPFVV